MSRRSVVAFLCALCAVTSVAGLRAQPPPSPGQSQLTFQARITQAGQPVSGVVSLTFKLLDSATPGQGQEFWSENHDGTPGSAPGVTCSNGIFSVVLGAVVPFPPGSLVPGGGDRYIAIVLGGSELARVKLTAGAYAVVSNVTGAVWDPVSGLPLDLAELDGRYFRRTNPDGSVAVIPLAAALQDPGTGSPLALVDLDQRYAVGVSDAGGAIARVNTVVFTGPGVTVSTNGGTATVNVPGGEIPTSAAGDGLTGGGGSPLAVAPGAGISVVADTVVVNPDDLRNGGLAALDGDRLRIDAFTPAQYSPTAVGGGLATDLAAHLKGIDDVLLSGVAQGGINKVVLRVFTNSGTYFPTTGMIRCLVICTGAGGGGGGADGDGSIGQACAGGGGGGGSTAIAVLTSAAVGASQPVMIGPAGAQGSNSGGFGGTGGTTSLGSLVTAEGGQGGQGVSGSGPGDFRLGQGGNGGSRSSTSSVLGSFGQTGDWGLVFANSPPGISRGGNGGGSFWCGGGQGGNKTHTVAGSSAGVTPSTYGAGGGGAAQVNTGTGAFGGLGGPGVCVIMEYCQ